MKGRAQVTSKFVPSLKRPNTSPRSSAKQPKESDIVDVLAPASIPAASRCDDINKQPVGQNILATCKAFFQSQYGRGGTKHCLKNGEIEAPTESIRSFLSHTVEAPSPPQTGHNDDTFGKGSWHLDSTAILQLRDA